MDGGGKIKDFLLSERGDTNIIEVVLIIAIVVALAVVLRGMVENGMEKVRELFENFLEFIGI